MIPTLFGRATAVLGDHARLHVLLDQLRKIANPEEGPALELELELFALVCEFEKKLSEHFAAEEDDGYFGTLTATVPALAGEVDRLCNEHDEFALMVQALVQLSRSAEDIGPFRLALKDFLERFRAHELAETRVLQTFFQRSGVP